VDPEESPEFMADIQDAGVCWKDMFPRQRMDRFSGRRTSWSRTGGASDTSKNRPVSSRRLIHACFIRILSFRQRWPAQKDAETNRALMQDARAAEHERSDGFGSSRRSVSEECASSRRKAGMVPHASSHPMVRLTVVKSSPRLPVSRRVYCFHELRFSSELNYASQAEYRVWPWHLGDARAQKLIPPLRAEGHEVIPANTDWTH
jgi:hypothetical protein